MKASLLFVTALTHSHALGQPRKPIRSGSAVAATNSNTVERSGATLRFAGDLTFDGDPIPSASSRDLSRFLVGEECRALLLSAGGTRRVESLPASPALEGMWAKQASRGFAGGLPDRADEFLRTDTVVRFPGLTLTNTVVNGFAIANDKSDPECVSLLVGESRNTSGAKPVVWLFNKLTGDGSRRPQEYSDPKACVVSRTSITKTENGAFAFQIRVKFQVVIDFPRSLMRLLPVSKDRMESRGSAAIKRALSKDFQQAVEGVREGFMASHLSTVVK